MGTERDTSILIEVRSSRSVAEIPVEGIEEHWQANIREILTEHAEIWNRRLGKIGAN